MEINPQLVPGSVWSLASGATSTVLAVSNVSLPDHLQEKFPSQVVYVNSKNEVNTQGVEAFVRKRTYDGIDPVIASAMAAITNPDIQEEGADLDIDEIDLEADTSTASSDALVDLTQTSNDSESEDDQIPVFIPPTVGEIDLDSAFISYSEMPEASGGRIHILRFALSQELTFQDVQGIFEGDQGLKSFIVDSEVERVEIDASESHGVFLEVDSNATGIAAVYLSSPQKLTGAALDAAIAAAEATIDNAQQATATAQASVASVTQPTHVIPQIQTIPNVQVSQPTVVVN